MSRRFPSLADFLDLAFVRMRFHVVEDAGQRSSRKCAAEIRIAHNTQSVPPPRQSYVDTFRRTQESSALENIGASDRENREVGFAPLKSINGMTDNFDISPLPMLLFQQISNVVGLSGVTRKHCYARLERRLREPPLARHRTRVKLNAINNLDKIGRASCRERV